MSKEESYNPDFTRLLNRTNELFDKLCPIGYIAPKCIMPCGEWKNVDINGVEHIQRVR
jgi:hypothetical protein